MLNYIFLLFHTPKEHIYVSFQISKVLYLTAEQSKKIPVCKLHPHYDCYYPVTIVSALIHTVIFRLVTWSPALLPLPDQRAHKVQLLKVHWRYLSVFDSLLPPADQRDSSFAHTEDLVIPDW